MPLFRSVVILALAAVASCTRAAPEVAPPPPAPVVLGPGDIVRVSAFQEKDIKCDDCQVDARGRLTLPLIGTYNVLGKPWEGLRDTLLAAYAHELRNPSVTISAFRRVQVLGEVTKPGLYYADPTLSLAGVVALAGGAAQTGDLRHIRVVRNGVTIVKSASVESILMQAGVQSNDQVFVDRRPWIERNGAFVASALISTAGVMIALIQASR